MMSSKRRTFHVDWDSPSHETGTVKRRPASLNASFSASLNNRFENVEYYELQDCVGGYGLKRLKLTESGSMNSIITENTFRTKVEVIVNDNENCLKYSELSHRRSEKNGDFKKFKTSAQAKQVQILENERRSFQEQSTVNLGKWEQNFFKYSFAKDLKFPKKDIKNEADKKFENIDKMFEKIHSQDAGDKVESKKIFDLKLHCEPIEWKPTLCRVIRRSESLKSRSLIPRPKVVRFCRTRGLVSSSSESSGFGSPLSPLSPQQDLLIKKEITNDVIKISDSKSSGIGSPESPSSPLSPESQKYSAFHLIQLQLEKLRKCPCEERQAEVIFAVL